MLVLLDHKIILSRLNEQVKVVWRTMFDKDP